ncbi:MAG: DUF5060 domain-containing protein [Acidiferrobacterales bacterium]|nr:DUF5060 domain-containing protein [Acidiferrobacterales bacterium]
MKSYLYLKYALTLAILLFGLGPVFGQGVINAEKNPDGSIKKWHRIELELTGPNLSEVPATFRNYRLDVTFTSPSNQIFKVPGFFDGDGDPANTSATSGNKWKARFTAGEEGTWTYSVSFKTGTDVAANLTGGSGGTAPDGQSGSFSVGSQDKTGKDFRAKGKLQYVGEHYLQFANGEYFIKAGANSPEVFLADEDFDGGVGNVDHSSQISSWNNGDPTWGNNKGKGIIGVVNYLSERGVNSHYFLSMNILGDGKRSYPYVDDDSPYTFDISKLAQWELVFSQFDKMGLMLHFVTTETENTQYFESLEGGSGSTQFAKARKIYYRELVARFGHHLAITWNIGEENNAPFGQIENSDSQRIAFADRFRELTYYQDNITIHNGGSGQSRAIDLYEDGGLLGNEDYTGTSLQLRFGDDNHDFIRYWYDKSADAGKKWVIAFDEAWSSNTFNVDTLRKDVIWGTLLAGGQMEWYHSGGSAGDLKTDRDYADLETQWDTIGYAANFMNANFSTNIHRMIPNDDLITNDNFAMADLGNTYLFYLVDGGAANVDLSDGAGSSFNVLWFNPRTGQSFADSNVNGGSSNTNLGNPPNSTTSDWVLLLRKEGTGGNIPPTASFSLPVSGASFTAPASPEVTVLASDSDGSITSVELFLDNVSIGQDTNSPYNWNNNSQVAALTGLPAGTYTLKAVATDDDGDSTTIQRTFIVGASNGNVPPTLSFNLPLNGTNLTAPASLVVSVLASDSDGSVSSVDLYLDDVLVRRENISPYNWNDSDQDSALSNLSNGTYTLRAVATDNDGGTSFAERIFTVGGASNQGPTVSFVQPTDGSTFSAPASVSVTVTANDSDGSILSVDLLLNNVLVRRESASPYQWNASNQNDPSLQNLGPGSYSLRAIATDNDGATSSVTQSFIVTSDGSVDGINHLPAIYFLLHED